MHLVLPGRCLPGLPCQRLRRVTAQNTRLLGLTLVAPVLSWGGGRLLTFCSPEPIILALTSFCFVFGCPSLGLPSRPNDDNERATPGAVHHLVNSVGPVSAHRAAGVNPTPGPAVTSTFRKVCSALLRSPSFTMSCWRTGKVLSHLRVRCVFFFPSSSSFFSFHSAGCIRGYVIM